MNRYEVVESRSWKNSRTGATASLYGAVPYQRDAESEGWAVVTNGFTIQDNVRGTVGIGRKPFTTKAEAQTVADEMESRVVSKREVPVSVAVDGGGRQVILVTVRSAASAANEAALIEAARLGHQDVKLFLETPSA